MLTPALAPLGEMEGFGAGESMAPAKIHGQRGIVAHATHLTREEIVLVDIAHNLSWR
jgi:hypothetical protein